MSFIEKIKTEMYDAMKSGEKGWKFAMRCPRDGSLVRVFMVYEGGPDCSVMTRDGLPRVVIRLRGADLSPVF